MFSCNTHQNLLNVIQVLWTLSNWESVEKGYLIIIRSIIISQKCGPRIVYTKTINPYRAHGVVMMKGTTRIHWQGQDAGNLQCPGTVPHLTQYACR